MINAEYLQKLELLRALQTEDFEEAQDIVSELMKGDPKNSEVLQEINNILPGEIEEQERELAEEESEEEEEPAKGEEKKEGKEKSDESEEKSEEEGDDGVDEPWEDETWGLEGKDWEWYYPNKENEKICQKHEGEEPPADKKPWVNPPNKS